MIFPRKKLILPCHKNGYLQSASDAHKWRDRFKRNPLAKVADMFIPKPLRMSPGYPCCCGEGPDPIYSNCSTYCIDNVAPAAFLATISGLKPRPDGAIMLPNGCPAACDADRDYIVPGNNCNYNLNLNASFYYTPDVYNGSGCCSSTALSVSISSNYLTVSLTGTYVSVTWRKSISTPYNCVDIDEEDIPFDSNGSVSSIDGSDSSCKLTSLFTEESNNDYDYARPYFCNDCNRTSPLEFYVEFLNVPPSCSTLNGGSVVKYQTVNTYRGSLSSGCTVIVYLSEDKCTVVATTGGGSMPYWIGSRLDLSCNTINLNLPYYSGTCPGGSSDVSMVVTNIVAL